MNPLNEFLSEYGTEKEAAFPGADSRFGHAVAGGIAAAGAGGVVAGVGMAATKAYDALTKGRDFKQMLSYNPDLQEHHDRDPRMFNQLYTSLRSVNPQFGKDPIIAGSFMRRMVDAPLTAGGALTSAVPSRAGGMANEVAMLGAGAGAAYYSDLNKSRARRDVDPAADLKSEHDRAEYEAAGRERRSTRMYDNPDVGHDVPYNPVAFDPATGKYHHHNPRQK